MYIFLPFPDFKMSAKVLTEDDLKRVALDSLELLDLLHQVVVRDVSLDEGEEMSSWTGHEAQLAEYGIICTEEYRNRTKSFELIDDGSVRKLYAHLDAASSGSLLKPDWIGDPEIHNADKKALVKHDKKYASLFPSAADEG